MKRFATIMRLFVPSRCQRRAPHVAGLVFILALATPFVLEAVPPKMTPRLSAVVQRSNPDETLLAWVYLREKASPQKLQSLPATRWVSERSLRRRQKVRPPQQLVDVADLPLEKSVVERVALHVMRIRQRSKWLNAVSVEATAAQLAALESLDCVRRIDAVQRFRRGAEPPASPLPARQTGGASGARGPVGEAGETKPGESGRARKPGASERGRKPGEAAGATALDYGASLQQLEMMGVPTLHTQGVRGQGVLIGHFDNGYRLLGHEVFASTQIVAAYDFVDHDPNPAPPDSAPEAYGAHGVVTLSVLGGLKPGDLVGVAYEADFVLARTENDASETPVEEDNWVAAIEWADSIGIDVATTSLAYLDFDSPHTSWTWEDMDGNTTAITRAADLAVARGIVVVNSTGNSGFNASHNTLMAPADGDSVIAVGAVAPDSTRATFSGVGPTTDVPPRFKPDVAAQGVSVWRASPLDSTGYGSSSGTSMSCPLVAGVAALLLSARPDVTPMQVRDALRLTASQASMPDNLLGWGIVNAVAALDWLNTTDVAVEPAVPRYRLEPNVPNPFNPSTRIRYDLAFRSQVTLRIYDAAGRRVRTLVEAAQSPRRYSAQWNGTDDRGRRLAAGVYLCRLEAQPVDRRHGAGFTAVRKMVYLP